MIENRSSWGGNFRPFPVPIDIGENGPDKLPHDAPLVCIRFNEFWYPYMQGALKALAREETYKGERSCIRQWVLAAHELITMEPDDCTEGEHPGYSDWHFNILGSAGATIEEYGFDSASRAFGYMSASANNVVTIQGRLRSSGDGAGGVVDQFYWYSGSASPCAYGITTCDDVYHSYYLTAATVFLADFGLGTEPEIKQIVITPTGSQSYPFLYMRWRDDHLC